MFNFIKKIKLLGLVFLLGSSSFVFGRCQEIDRLNLFQEVLEDMFAEEDQDLQREIDDIFAHAVLTVINPVFTRLGRALREGDLEFIDRGIRTTEAGTTLDPDQVFDNNPFDPDEPWPDFEILSGEED